MGKDPWKNVVIISGVMSLLIAVLAIGIAIPMLMSDGWEKLDGIAREEDRPYILGYWSGIDVLSSSKPGGPFAKTRVERVEYTPVGSCTDKGGVDSYTITTRTVGIFGVTVDETAHRPPLKCSKLRD